MNRTTLLLTQTVLRWTARLTSLVSIAVVLMFAVADGFNPLNLTPREGMLFLCFPLGVMTGLVMAWKWEGLGGALALGALAGFYALHLAVAGQFPRGWALAVLTVPGLIFLLANAGDRFRHKA